MPSYDIRICNKRRGKPTHKHKHTHNVFDNEGRPSPKLKVDVLPAYVLSDCSFENSTIFAEKSS